MSLLIHLLFAVNHAPPPAPVQPSSGGSMLGSIGSTIAQGIQMCFYFVFEKEHGKQEPLFAFGTISRMYYLAFNGLQKYTMKLKGKRVLGESFS